MPKKAKNTRKRIINIGIGNYNLSTGDPEDPPTLDFRSLTLRKMETLEFLNGANMPSKFRFREAEIEKISAFLTSCINKEKKGYRFMMVTGSPGAGKTLSVNSVLSSLDCEVIRMNANIVKSVAEVQQLICLKLLGESNAQTALQIIRQLQQAKYKKTCVVCIQQIQLLFKSAPGIVSEDFLTLFLKKSINLVLLGISNTIDTLQKYSDKYSFKITQIENIVFAPYKAQHIMSILTQKIQIIKQRFQITIDFSQKLLRFATQKLQTLKKGDFRICLEFLKEVVRLSFATLTPKEEEENSKFVINIGLINDTFNKMNISKNQLMEKLPYQQIIILIALHNIISKTSALYVSLKELHTELKWICGSLQIGFNAGLMEERINDLEQYGMVSMRKKSSSETQIILQVSSEDIKMSFGDNELLGKYIINE